MKLVADKPLRLVFSLAAAAALLFALMMGSASAADPVVKAFPGAEGYAQYASGGRGGQVVIVNTTKDVSKVGDGLVSLREALEGVGDAKDVGARYITFSVGGVFDVTEKSTCGNKSQPKEIRMCGQKNVTIACQTAPYPGVIIRSAGIRIMNGSSELIMRHCTLRNIDPGTNLLPPGPLREGQPKQADSSTTLRSVLSTTLPSKNIIFDHVSLSWATDEGFTTYIPYAERDGRDSHNITLSNSIVAEGDPDSSHQGSGYYPKNYRHSLGPSCASADDNNRIVGCSFVNNFMAHNGKRNLKLLSTSGELVNNIVYDWGTLGMEFPKGKRGGTNYTEAYAVGNLFKAGPATRSSKNCVGASEATGCVVSLNQKSSASKYSIRDNHFIPIGGTFADVAPLNVEFNERPTIPMPTRNKNILKMAAKGSDHMKCVGASVPSRDAIDARLINEFHTGTGFMGIFTDGDDGRYEDQERRWYMYPAVGVEKHHPANFDRDKDGMADAWERTKGLNPNANDANGKKLGGGYDNIEHYVNELADSCSKNPPVVATPLVVATPPAVANPPAVATPPVVVTPPAEAKPPAVVTPPAVAKPPATLRPPRVNLIRNPAFSNGRLAWNLYSARRDNSNFVKSGRAVIQVTTPNNEKVTKANLRLNQTGVALESGQKYRLLFQAKSSEPSGSLRVQLRKTSKTTQSLGIKNSTIKVSKKMRTYAVDFEATGFRGTTKDSRLTFNFLQSPDATYTIDNVKLIKIN